MLCAISAAISSFFTYVYHKRKSDLHIRICKYQIDTLMGFLRLRGFSAHNKLPDNDLFCFKTDRFNLIKESGRYGRYESPGMAHSYSDYRHILFKENLSVTDKYHVQLLSLCDEAQGGYWGYRLDPGKADIDPFIYDYSISLFTNVKFHDHPDTLPERTESDLKEEIRMAVDATIRSMAHSEIRESIDAALWMLTYSAVTTAEKFVDSDDCY